MTLNELKKKKKTIIAKENKRNMTKMAKLYNKTVGTTAIYGLNTDFQELNLTTLRSYLVMAYLRSNVAFF